MTTLDGMFTFEPATEGDRAFILDSWIRGARDNPRIAWSAEGWRAQAEKCTRLLAGNRTIVARPVGWPEGIAAWATGDVIDGVYVLDWAHTKRRYRKLGLALELMRRIAGDDEFDGRVYTHQRDPMARFLDRRGFRFDGALALRSA